MYIIKLWIFCKEMIYNITTPHTSTSYWPSSHLNLKRCLNRSSNLFIRVKPSEVFSIIPLGFMMLHWITFLSIIKTKQTTELKARPSPKYHNQRRVTEVKKKKQWIMCILLIQSYLFKIHYKCNKLSFKKDHIHPFFSV